MANKERIQLTANKERVQLLVEALRSEEYIQGSGMLHRKLHASDEYCCLGVACNIAIKNGLEVIVKPDEDIPYEITYDGCNSFMPGSVARWYGFNTDDPIIAQNSNTKERIIATGANDALRWDFNQIADAFERTYLTNGK